MKRNILLIWIVIFCSGITGFGQQTEAERAQQERERYNQQRQIAEQESRMVSQPAKDWTKSEVFRKRTQSDDESETLTDKDIREIRDALAPAPEDQARYKTFLEHSNTGLFRLMPNFGCSQQKKIVAADERCAKSIYIGEFYSFRKKDYSNADRFDLTFKDGNLISKGFFSQGILTALGDIPLENISINDSGIKFLTDYQPAKTIEKVKEQFREINAGIKIGNYQYSKSVQAMPETTYALRVIAYRPGNSISGRKSAKTEEESKIIALNEDKRSDVTVVFRIVRSDDDGSLIILWKYLGESKSPKLDYLETKNSTDNDK